MEFLKSAESLHRYLCDIISEDEDDNQSTLLLHYFSKASIEEMRMHLKTLKQEGLVGYQWKGKSVVNVVIHSREEFEDGHAISDHGSRR